MNFGKSSAFLAPLAVLTFGAACSSDVEPAAESVEAAAAEPVVVAQAVPQPAETASSSFPTAPLIDPNSASAAEMAEVPGLSDAAVTAVLAGRPFATPTELHAVIGALLGEDEQKQVYERMFIKVGLTSGANEDYRLIPSTMPARKLAHEFEEYRPYESMDQFRREMSKYVSDDEVAYLVRFVTLD